MSASKPRMSLDSAVRLCWHDRGIFGEATPRPYPSGLRITDLCLSPVSYDTTPPTMHYVQVDWDAGKAFECEQALQGI